MIHISIYINHTPCSQILIIYVIIGYLTGEKIRESLESGWRVHESTRGADELVRSVDKSTMKSCDLMQRTTKEILKDKTSKHSYKYLIKPPTKK